MTARTPPVKKTFLLQPEWLMALGLTLVAVWLHGFFLVHAGGFWRDEVNLINLASNHSLGYMAQDSFPLLMPLVVHGWSGLGLAHSEVGLRSLGILIGLGIVAAFWLTAWTSRRSPPLLGLALLAFNSTVISCGDSIRAYGLGSLLIVLAAGAAWAFFKKPSWPRAGIFTVAAVLSVQALYQNAILIAAICAGIFAVCARGKKWRAAIQIFLAGLVAAVSLLPYVPILVSGRAAMDALRTGLQLTRARDNLTIVTGFPYAPYRFVWCALALGIIAGGCFALRRRHANTTSPAADFSDEPAPEDLRLFAGTTLLAALAGYAGFLWFAALPTQPWYFLPLLALAAVCFDAGLPPLTGILRAVVLGFILVTAALGARVAARDLNYRFTNIDFWARQLAVQAAPGDFVIVTPWYCGISFDHYFKSPTPWTTVPPLPDHATHRYDLVKIQMQQADTLQPVLEKIVTTLAGGHRVWVVAGVGWMTIPAATAPPPALLPPPPLPASGWLDAPYTYTWTAQIAHLLRHHSLQFGRVDNPTAGMHIGENMELFLADGWKNSNPTNSQAKNP